MLNKKKKKKKVVLQLYKKYKLAFDLVYKYSSPDNNEIRNILYNLIENEKTIRFFHSNKT